MKQGIVIAFSIVVCAARLGGSSCRAVEGDRILASDLAQALPVFANLDPGLMIAYTPAPGLERSLSRNQLRRLARRHGLPDSGIEDVCFNRRVERLSRGRILRAIRSALKLPGAELELIDFSRAPVPDGKLRFRLSELPRPPHGANDPVLWRGALLYGHHRSVPVWVRVRISVMRRRVVALRDLPAGQPVRTSDITQETVREFPASATAARSVDEVVGSKPRRRIRAGEPLLLSWLRLPNDIERGETIQVEVTSGLTLIRFDAKAETGGRRGEQIYVRNPVSGKRFAALVQDKGKAIVRVGAY